MKTTYEQRLTTALLARGFVEDHTDKSRYRAFVKDTTRLFVGQFGALRRGECASRSHSIGDPQNQTAIYQNLLKEGATP